MTPPPAFLLVDDDAVFRERLARSFSLRGWHVSTAPDPASALALWNGQAFAGAVVDLRLATESGLELVPLLRRRWPEARIVVLTGFGSITTAVEAGRLGVSEYLTKPVDTDRLMAALTGATPTPPPKGAPTSSVPSLDLVEWEHIQRVLRDCAGNVSQAARLLGIDRRSLQRKLAKHPPHR